MPAFSAGILAIWTVFSSCVAGAPPRKRPNQPGKGWAPAPPVPSSMAPRSSSGSAPPAPARRWRHHAMAPATARQLTSPTPITTTASDGSMALNDAGCEPGPGTAPALVPGSVGGVSPPLAASCCCSCCSAWEDEPPPAPAPAPMQSPPASAAARACGFEWRRSSPSAQVSRVLRLIPGVPLDQTRRPTETGPACRRARPHLGVDHVARRLEVVAQLGAVRTSKPDALVGHVILHRGVPKGDAAQQQACMTQRRGPPRRIESVPSADAA